MMLIDARCATWYTFYVVPSNAAFFRGEKMFGLFAFRGYEFRPECNSDSNLEAISGRSALKN